MFLKEKRIENRELLDEIKKLPCIADPRFKKDKCVYENGLSDPHHVKTKGSGGEDTKENVMPLCRKHHTEWDLGISKFLDKYPASKKWLEKNNHWHLLDKIANLNFNFKTPIEIRTGS